MKRLLILFCIAVGVTVMGADFQWAAKIEGVVSSETGDSPEGYLWIPRDCKSVTALMFAFQNMNEETLFRMERFRRRMEEADVALLWIAPGFGQEWDADRQDIQGPFDRLIDTLAVKSGHPELASVPLIPFGHSAQATMPWNFAAWNPYRTLCVISYHGDAPRTNLCGYGRANVEWGRTRNIDGIPGLMVEGEYEWWEARINPALAFRMMYPRSCISFLGDAGRGHFDLSEQTADYIARFIEKSIEKRLCNDGLKPIDPHDGWLAARWHPDEGYRPQAAPFNQYKGCRHEAFWYFDEEMAMATEARYVDTDGKRPSWLGFISDGGSLYRYNPKGHCKIIADIVPDKDDSFVMTAVFTDSTRTLLSGERDNSLVRVRYVSGPAREVGANRFVVDRKHPTWKNPRRRGKITLCAEAPSDSVYKGVVQEIEVTVR